MAPGHPGGHGAAHRLVDRGQHHHHHQLMVAHVVEGAEPAHVAGGAEIRARAGLAEDRLVGVVAGARARFRNPPRRACPTLMIGEPVGRKIQRPLHFGREVVHFVGAARILQVVQACRHWRWRKPAPPIPAASPGNLLRKPSSCPCRRPWGARRRAAGLLAGNIQAGLFTQARASGRSASRAQIPGGCPAWQSSRLLECAMAVVRLKLVYRLKWIRCRAPPRARSAPPGW